MFRGARLGGFPTLEQLHSSVVIEKDTSSIRGPEEDGCGGQVVQEVVEQHPQISLSVVTFLRAGNRKQ